MRGKDGGGGDVQGVNGGSKATGGGARTMTRRCWRLCGCDKRK